MSLLPPTSSSDDVQSKKRLGPSTKSETSRFCQNFPSRKSRSQSHRRISTHEALDSLLREFASILEDNKVLGVIGNRRWIVWIHEELKLDKFRVVCVRPIHLIHLLHLRNKRKGVLNTEGNRAAED
jgi:hypothetical protein